MNQRARFASIAAASLFVGAAAFAQAPAPAFGTSSLSSEVVSSMDLQTDQSSTTWATDSQNGHRYMTSAGLFYAPLHVPQGSRIVTIELEACDPLSGGSVDVYLFRANAAGRTQIGFVSTGIDEMSGCSRWSIDLAAPETVDNDAYRYFVEVGTAPSDETETVGAIRVYYELQVSPAPGTATFNDVPTGHPFFQFVEALAASGITAGCGGGNFCPDNPLTRGQMAVFLAKALGLHFPSDITTK